MFMWHYLVRVKPITRRDKTISQSMETTEVNAPSVQKVQELKRIPQHVVFHSRTSRPPLPPR